MNTVTSLKRSQTAQQTVRRSSWKQTSWLFGRENGTSQVSDNIPMLSSTPLNVQQDTHRTPLKITQKINFKMF